MNAKPIEARIEVSMKNGGAILPPTVQKLKQAGMRVAKSDSHKVVGTILPDRLENLEHVAGISVKLNEESQISPIEQKAY